MKLFLLSALGLTVQGCTNILVSLSPRCPPRTLLHPPLPLGIFCIAVPPLLTPLATVASALRWEKWILVLWLRLILILPPLWPTLRRRVCLAGMATLCGCLASCALWRTQMRWLRMAPDTVASSRLVICTA